MVAIAIAICSAVWYGFQYWRIIVGLESSNIKQLSELVGLSWSESLFYGVKGLTRKLTPLWVVFLIASLFHPYVRHMTSWMVLPFIVLWATFVPYDYRNLAAIFPLLALSLVYGWCQIVNALQTKWFFDDKVTRAIRGASVAAVCIVLGAVFSKPHYGEELIRISERAKLKMGDPEINFRLLAFYEINPAPSLLATPYAFAGNIPALAGRYRPLGCGLATFGHAANLDEIMSEIQSLQIKQVLLLPWCDSKVLEVFATESSRFRRIFQVNGAVFYEVLR